MSKKVTGNDLKKLIEQVLKEDRRDLLEERVNFKYKKLPYDITGHKAKVKTALGTTTSGANIDKVASVDGKLDKLSKKRFRRCF